MRRYLPAFIAMTFLATLGAPVLASAQTIAPCPVEPENAIAVTAATYPASLGLTDTAVSAATKAVRAAGLVPVAAAAPSTPPVFTPFGPVRPNGPAVGAACVPTLALNVSTSIPQAITMSVTRYTERVAVTVLITMPDGRTWQGSQSATVAWYAGYAPLPYTPGLPISGIPIATSQTGAEQHAVETMAVGLAKHAVTLLHGLAPAPTTPAP